MRQGHLMLLFLMIYTYCFLVLYMEQEKYDRVQEEKQKIEQALLDAVENTGREFRSVINASEEEKKKVLEQSFLDSLYISMELLETAEQKEQLKMHLPMLVFVEEDGAFFYCMKELQSERTEVSHEWREKIEFFFSENITEAEKKAIIEEILEKEASEIISNHNYIAVQYGISYTYFVPGFLQNTSEKLEFPMLFVVFQGWPLTASGDIVYENCMDAGVFLQQKEYYVVEYPKSLSEPVCFYHQSSCTIVKEENHKIFSENVTMQEAVQKYGAYPCSTCILQ